MHYIYSLKCKDGFYIGCTDAITDRLERHQKGQVPATANRLPVNLEFYFAVGDKYKAFEFERYLKSGSGRAFINKHLAENPPASAVNQKYARWAYFGRRVAMCNTRDMKSIFTVIEERVRAYLSHRPKVYALIVGVGIVLFWRGVWHTADLIHTYFIYYQNNMTIDSTASPWWDGPLSFIVGSLMLYFTGAFTSSFIGNELILSGLRGERRLNQKEEHEIESEAHAIGQIRSSLRDMTLKLDKLEERIRKHH